jgi:hypothetical protein
LIGETVEVMPLGFIYFAALLIGYGVIVVVSLVALWIVFGFAQELMQDTYEKIKTK